MCWCLPLKFFWSCQWLMTLARCSKHLHPRFHSEYSQVPDSSPISKHDREIMGLTTPENPPLLRTKNTKPAYLSIFQWAFFCKPYDHYVSLHDFLPMARSGPHHLGGEMMVFMMVTDRIITVMVKIIH